jgi:hypothetical protein
MLGAETALNAVLEGGFTAVIASFVSYIRRYQPFVLWVSCVVSTSAVADASPGSAKIHKTVPYGLCIMVYAVVRAVGVVRH